MSDAPASAPVLTREQLVEALRVERLSAYVRLRGGFPIPLAGATYWAVLGVLGFFLEPPAWSMLAFIGSGTIFPLALLYAKLFRNPFMKERTAVDSVLVPAFASMLLFWAMIVGAAQEGATLVPLILAVGMSIHWPVIGWSYGRTAIFTGHAVVRAVLAVILWLALPDARLTLLPFSVSLVYLATVIVIYVDSGRMRARSG